MKGAYSVKLDIFEGPLDLLLHLIKRSELEIYDISVSAITEQYLEYVELLKDMNLDLAGEYLVMAATLTHIKSKMLLPITEEEEEEDEGPDPRRDLIRKLLEYERFKEAAIDLGQRLVLGRDVFTRGAPFPVADLGEDEDASALVDVTVMDLMEAFRDILASAPKDYEIDLTVERFRVKDKINHVMEVMGRDKSVVFKELFAEDATKGEVIVTFLAILEIAKIQLIRVNQTEDGVIRLYLSAPAVAGSSSAPVDEYN